MAQYKIKNYVLLIKSCYCKLSGFYPELWNKIIGKNFNLADPVNKISAAKLTINKVPQDFCPAAPETGQTGSGAVTEKGGIRATDQATDLSQLSI